MRITIRPLALILTLGVALALAARVSPVIAQGERQLIPISLQNIDRLTELETPIVGSAPINAVLISPDEAKLVVSESGSGAPVAQRIIVWDIPTRQRLRSWLYVGVSPESLNISPDGQSIAGLAVGDTGGSLPTGPVGVVEWNLSTGRVIRQFANPVGDPTTNVLSESLKAARISPDGRYVLSGSADGTFYFWERATGRLLQTIPPDAGNRIETTNALFSTSGHLAATCSGDGAIHLWAVSENRLKPLSVLRGKPGEALCVMAISPDAHYVAAIGQKGILVWESASGDVIRILGLLRYGRATPDNHALVFSKDGSLLVVMIANREANITRYEFREMRSGQIVRYVERSQWASSMVLSQTGALLASGVLSGRVLLWGVRG